METGLLCIAGAAAAILIIRFAMENWPRSPQAEFDYRHAQWMQSCRERGLSARQSYEEFLFRNAWARLSRRASQEIAAGPSAYREVIARIAADETKALALADKGVARRFLGVVNSAPLSDILYDDAMAAIDGFHRGDTRGAALSAQAIADATAAVTLR